MKGQEMMESEFGHNSLWRQDSKQAGLVKVRSKWGQHYTWKFFATYRTNYTVVLVQQPVICYLLPYLLYPIVHPHKNRVLPYGATEAF